MDMKSIPFGTTDWSQIAITEQKGETGLATWRTQQFDTLRVRMDRFLRLHPDLAGRFSCF